MGDADRAIRAIEIVCTTFDRAVAAFELFETTQLHGGIVNIYHCAIGGGRAGGCNP